MNENKTDMVTTTGGTSTTITAGQSGYFTLGIDPLESATDWTAMLRETPHDPQAYFNRGNIYYVSGDVDQALADYSTALEINPEMVDALYNRGIALADFNTALALDPKNKNALAGMRLINKEKK